ncbi:MAG: tRNA (N(6)-L-threonylcarbamoyladenosine(37)-C(2))-methylthiotransferase MtaB [Holosporaceae bacterium]|jgi:threonylcarbamoyladenosine tRNA methylthiotransferase MtaB|nr:tRNA (N(6)-L-threonylcarbamoyladenosine(37)-C(2))-methylthiotransferase MtaB [Holosporaceae bacterium]
MLDGKERPLPHGYFPQEQGKTDTSVIAQNQESGDTNYEKDPLGKNFEQKFPEKQVMGRPSVRTSGDVITFGCRLNACESEIIYNFARELGLENVIIINTCAVTAEAERKLRQTIRKLHQENNDVKIILTGCASELNPDFYIQMDGVAGIISNKMKLSRDEYLKYVQNRPNVRIGEDGTYHGKIRGFLQIQNGCDQRCSYCIVRLARGSNVSFSRDDILAQAKKLLQKGYQEIVLTGVNVSSYGRGVGDSLASLITYLLKNIPALRRLRLSSLDPADLSDELIRVITQEERLLPHVHESIQSGDDLILKRMVRRHSSMQIIEINEKILSWRPEIIFGADIMVGFPTETDAMFENTKSLMKKAKISLLHVFPFSSRPGTPAAGMPMVDKKIRLARAADLRNLAQELQMQKMQEFVGKNVIILAESEYVAKTNSFLQVRSRKKLASGREYLFHCESHEKKYIIGNPIEING